MNTMITDAGSMFAGMTDAHIAHAVRSAEAHYCSIGSDPLACDVALIVLRDCDAPEAGNPVSADLKAQAKRLLRQAATHGFATPAPAASCPTRKSSLA